MPPQAYFADGVGDEIRGKLSQLAGLAVLGQLDWRHAGRPLNRSPANWGLSIC